MTKAHDVLGVEAGADEAAINAAFRRAAKSCHPDLNGGDRAGERRLRRLIAARDYLTNRRRRLTRAGRGLLRLQAPGKGRRFLAAGGLAFSGVLLLLCLISEAWQAEPAVGPFETATVYLEEEDVPDAGSAEVKAIRDVREMISYKEVRVEPDWMAPDPPLHESPGPARQISKPAPGRFQDALGDAASGLSRAWRKLSAKLRGI
jgi:curved DNA-binding protein CbpA